MTYLISYGLHMLVSFIFFLLIPFSFLIKGSLLDEPGRFQFVLKIYKRIIWLGHGALIVGLISGFLMTSDWLNAWFILVVAIWAALGAFLGLTAKEVRKILEGIEAGKEIDDDVAKLRLYSFLLMLAILSMFTAKILYYL
ncbi:hypothetical protein [Halalkalibacter nanhaiisediminis]|uniref:Uncharacterized protein n=1 Tax=Halalkalibacter nanhaiisediminis TaxID=688079 RepID=A0A562QTC7_9BACI|nr:hypothetical protein [Halalkalibacter nanhaiisediminis]TWI59336.1 hypothetical protein IQ10_01052 [Halalkalibacter nanhaiisediminis]